MGEVLDVNLNEVPFRENDNKFEFKIIVSNVSNLVEDSKALFKRNWKILLLLGGFISFLILFPKIKSLIYDVIDDSKVIVSTINCGGKDECDIELIKKDAKGKIIWKQIIGGTSYDKAGQVVKTKAGDYLVVGSTSSFGKGNYDVLIVKVNALGEILWQKTYGEFLNDYGLKISSVNRDLYSIEATKQICKTVNVSNDCIDQQWLFKIDDEGNIK